jgi:hypothetical protein
MLYRRSNSVLRFYSAKDNNTITSFKNNYLRIEKIFMYLSYILQIAHQNNHKLYNKRNKNLSRHTTNNRSCTKFYHGFQLWFLTYTKY